MTQHVFEDSVHIKSACLINIQTIQSKTVIRYLPEMYKDIPPVALKISTPRPYIIYECQPPQTHEYPGHVTLQKILLQYVLNTIGKSTLEARDYLSWSAFCAKMQSPVSRPPAITSLFPLFRDSAHTAATVKHGMTIIKGQLK